MPWVKIEDRYPANRKIALLSDGAFRLDVEALCWASENGTDGVIRKDELAVIHKAGKPRNAAELVRRGRWHCADGEPCGSDRCPPPGPDGWVIHDFWDYQPSRADVDEQRATRRERQKRWRERHPGTGRYGPSTNGSNDASRNASTDGLQDALVTPAPSRPVPSPKTKPSSSAPPTDDDPNWAAFWDAYPRKVGKGAARNAWSKAIKAAEPAEIITGAKRYADQRHGQDPQYTAHPATWLNHERWTDQPAATTTGEGWWND